MEKAIKGQPWEGKVEKKVRSKEEAATSGKQLVAKPSPGRRCASAWPHLISSIPRSLIRQRAHIFASMSQRIGNVRRAVFAGLQSDGTQKMQKADELRRDQTALAYTRSWHHFDASGEVLGRLSNRIALILMGKHKPVYDPSSEGRIAARYHKHQS